GSFFRAPSPLPERTPLRGVFGENGRVRAVWPDSPRKENERFSACIRPRRRLGRPAVQTAPRRGMPLLRPQHARVLGLFTAGALLAFGCGDTLNDDTQEPLGGGGGDPNFVTGGARGRDRTGGAAGSLPNSGGSAGGAETGGSPGSGGDGAAATGGRGSGGRTG